MEYPVLQVEKVKKVLGDRLLVLWEEAKKDLLGGRLVKPDTHRSGHYTGIILKRGIHVDNEDLKEGQRILWEQFSGFEKYQSPNGDKRYAIVKEPAVLCTLPLRAKVNCDDWSTYGDGD